MVASCRCPGEGCIPRSISLQGEGEGIRSSCEAERRGTFPLLLRSKRLQLFPVQYDCADEQLLIIILDKSWLPRLIKSIGKKLILTLSVKRATNSAATERSRDAQLYPHKPVMASLLHVSGSRCSTTGARAHADRSDGRSRHILTTHGSSRSEWYSTRALTKSPATVPTSSKLLWIYQWQSWCGSHESQ